MINNRYCPAILHRLKFIKVICVFRGKCGFFYQGKRIEMTKGNVCIVAPGVEQAVFSCHDEDVIINVLIRASSFSDVFAETLKGQNILEDSV